VKIHGTSYTFLYCRKIVSNFSSLAKEEYPNEERGRWFGVTVIAYIIPANNILE